MKEITVVTNVYKQASLEGVDMSGCTGRQQAWLEKMSGCPLDIGEGYLIARDDANRILSLFYTEQEETAFKITLTGVKPFQKFSLMREEGAPLDIKCANQAGIIEFRITIPANTGILMKQILPDADCR